MFDFGRKWTPVPDWERAVIDEAGVKVTALTQLHELMVSGDIEAGLASLCAGVHAQGPEGRVQGEPYALRLARDRVLLVAATSQPGLRTGWHGAGFAVSDLTGGHVVFEITGPVASDLLAQGVYHPLEGRTGSVLSRIAGLTVAVYAREDAGTWRVHVERAMAAYLWQWLAAQV